MSRLLISRLSRASIAWSSLGYARPIYACRSMNPKDACLVEHPRVKVVLAVWPFGLANYPFS